jgi:hypothetical protein
VSASVSTTAWHYTGTASSLVTSCTSAGGTWVSP